MIFRNLRLKKWGGGSVLIEFIHCVNECQTDCQRAREQARAHCQNTVAEDFFHRQCLLTQFFSELEVLLKDFVEFVEEYQANNQRRTEKSRAEHQNC